MRRYNIAILGVNTLIGKELLKILIERNFPVNALRLLALSGGGKRHIIFKDADYFVDVVNEKSFRGINLSFFLENENVIHKYAILSKESGSIVIDTSNNFSLEEHVPLIIPEVNKDSLRTHAGIIASPYPAAIFLCCCLKPIFIRVGIKKVNAICLHPVIEQGEEAQKELRLQTKDYLLDELPPQEIAAFYQAFNLIPYVGEYSINGATTKEVEIANQVKKIINEPKLKIIITSIKVPVFRCITIVCNVETVKPLTKEEVIAAFASTVTLEIVDNPEQLIYPTPLSAEGKDKILVSRIRVSSATNELNFVIIGDNLRKGSALNLVQIAEELIRVRII